jgi:hypothetical protein
MKVTMSLTDRDVANAEKICGALNAQNNAHAVSIALSLTGFIVEQLKSGNDPLLRSPDGELCRIVMNELGNAPAWWVAKRTSQ